jgi:hypothetical protein
VVELRTSTRRAPATCGKAVSGACALQQSSPIEPAFAYNYYYGTTHSHQLLGRRPADVELSIRSAYGSGSFDPTPSA